LFYEYKYIKKNAEAHRATLDARVRALV